MIELRRRNNGDQIVAVHLAEPLRTQYGARKGVLVAQKGTANWGKGAYLVKAMGENFIVTREDIQYAPHSRWGAFVPAHTGKFPKLALYWARFTRWVRTR